MSPPLFHLSRWLAWSAFLAIAACTLPADALAARKKNPTSKLFVTDMNGSAEMATEDKIVELSKKSVYSADGTTVETKKPENLKPGEKAFSSMVYSNGTGIHFDPDTKLEVTRFVQEPFQPNRTDMEMEPSISQTQTFLSRGVVGLCTSKLVAGSSMVYQTPHGAVNIRGRKIVIESHDTHTRIAMLEGESTVRGGTGSAVDMGGQTLRAGQQALIRPGAAGQPPIVEISKIPERDAAKFDDKVAMACMAKKTVYFDVADRKSESDTRNAADSADQAVNAFDEDSEQEIVPIEVVPVDLPVQFTVSAAKLGSG